MRIAIIGTGYVGLVTGTCFAESGNDVLCVDNNPEKLAMLRRNEVPIYEPGLEVLFSRNIQEGRLKFTDSVPDAVEFAEIIFLALPTPPLEDGSADLQYILSVAAEIGECISEYRVVVNKSTVPVGTVEAVRETIAARTAVEFDVVSNPEFLREGVAVEDFMKPERVVVGARSERAKRLMERLFRPFVLSGNPILFMDERSAEVTKYAANAFLATKISFMNEVANLCERVGADVDSVRKGIGSDSRIGKRFLFAGAGYGGSCFPKDVQALAFTADQHGYDFRILKSVMEVNQSQKMALVHKLLAFMPEGLAGKRIGVWGLAFKPNTDDIREAPALAIAQELIARGAGVVAYDPVAMPAMKRYYPGLAIQYAENMYEVAKNADAVLLVTEWGEFRNLDFKRLKGLMNTPALFDGRNIYDTETLMAEGFYYASIGRGTIDARVAFASQI